METPRRLIPAYLAAFAISICLLPQNHAVAESLEVNGIEMYYEIVGEGEPLVLLHGWLQSGDTWDEVAAELQQDFQIIMPDFRGHGASTNPSGTYITKRQLALDVYALLDHLKIDTFKAMGISMGGSTLLHMATQQPERIKAMVLIGAAPYLGERERELMRGTNSDNVPEETMRELRKVHKYGHQQIISLMEMDKIAIDDYQDMSFTPPYLSTIKAKTLIVQGERDRHNSIDTGLELYKSIPESFLWIVPNAGHVPIRDAYQDIFVNTARSFLSDQMVPRRGKMID
jgi:pimeloyl-ACP methyl ester carboxylesterase